jgi:hypothetical protein
MFPLPEPSSKEMQPSQLFTALAIFPATPAPSAQNPLGERLTVGIDRECAVVIHLVPVDVERRTFHVKGKGIAWRGGVDGRTAPEEVDLIGSPSPVVGDLGTIVVQGDVL